VLHAKEYKKIICLCFKMVSFGGQKKVGPRPVGLVSFRGLIQNFRGLSRPFHIGAPPPPEVGGGGQLRRRY